VITATWLPSGCAARAILDGIDRNRAFGVYVHVPFCAHRCDYCDFATWTDRAHLVDAYVDACTRDLERWYRQRADLPDASSVFFGGGTPSLLPPRHLARILDALRRRPDAEVTVECNPDSVTAEHFAIYTQAGVNRVSLGMQSDRPHVLAALGRTHDRANVAHAVADAREAGIARINLDLIYGTPGETVGDWDATLDAALALTPDHISAYALTVEPGTPLGAAVRDGRALAPDDDDQATKYELADERLTAAGFEWYEISNWARASDPARPQACRHNELYWTMGEYLPMGCAAHGHLDGRRFWNVRTPERYIEAIAADRSPEAGSETLDAAGRAAEAVTLALRTRTGIADPQTENADALVAVGLLDRTLGRLVLTRRGRLLANEVTTRLLADDPPPGALALDTIEC
jgi:oxygen-independent coproporphyrinogen-3 oxidase